MPKRRRSATADLPEAGKLSYWLVTQRQRVAKPYLTGRVLDFGCGGGGIAEICAPDSYVGFDIDPRMIEIARKEWPQHRYETSLPDDERFDTVAAIVVIEHLPDPGEHLRDWARYLNPNGRIVMTTPHPTLEWIHTAGAKVGVFSQHADEGHEDLIDRATMEKLIAGTNLRLTTYKRFLGGANQLFVLTAVDAPSPR